MLLCVYLLYCLLQVNSGCEVDRGRKPDITKSVGDSVVLPCFCKNPKDKPHTVQWGYTKTFKLGVYKPEVMVFPEDDRQSQRYRGRVKLQNQNATDLSLILSDLTEEDGGTYLCGVSAVNLYVKDLQGCTVLGSGENRFTKSPGESVLLPCPCPSDSNITPKTVTWSFSKEEKGEKKTPVSNVTESYRSRVWTFDQEMSRNFSLLVSDLTKEDSRYYFCTVYEDNPLYLLLNITGCALLENKQTVTISRSPGDSVLLSCSCTELQDKPETVQWRTPHHGDLLSTELPQRYSSRVQTFNHNSPGNLSVLISDLTEEDGGRYSCWINQNQYRHFNLSVKVCTLSEPQEKEISKYPGDSVLLPCSCTDPNTKPLSVKWQRGDSGGTEVSSGTDGYNGRLHMFNEGLPANLSQLISNLTEQDQGTYRCTINNNQSVSITLNVKVCTLSEPQEKEISKYPGDSVLLPCSCTDPNTKPLSCTLSEPQRKKIIRSPGDSVLLPCSCTDPNTKPLSVKWQRVDSGGTEVSSGTPLYTGRVHMFNDVLPGNVLLLISNLTEQDQGTYRCTIHNNQSVNITLNIQDLSGSASSLLRDWNLIIIIIFSVFLLTLLLLLGGAPYNFWKFGKGRRKRSEEETKWRPKDTDWTTFTSVIYQETCKSTQDQFSLIMPHTTDP
ncbi:polymeric immunoglobulin receptor-like [Hoplias malabaricus]|uniref:polymeric immunoglobulin receptor-like n=1 Tax=Hoplias malabaricus TaxID=27720 RepID=UPI00346309EB